MTRIEVDFNSIDEAGFLTYLLTLVRVPVQEGERLVLYDADGLEVQAVVDTIKNDRAHFRIDFDTFVDAEEPALT